MCFRVLIALLLVGCVAPATAQTSVRIGVAAPTSGPNAMLGRQVAEGARQAAERDGAVLTVMDTECTADGGRRAADSFVAAKVVVVVGFLCTDSLEAALPVLRTARIAAIDVGVRADRFTAKRAKTGDLIWRIAPSSGAAAGALTDAVVSRWRAIPFGILDDGSVQNRALADGVREGIEAAGLTAATIDTYRPAEEKQFGLVRRLERTGVTHFVVAGEGADAAAIARDAAVNGVAIELIGGEQLLDEPPDAAELPIGTLAIAPQDRFSEIGAKGRADEPEQRGYFGAAFAAVEIAVQAVRRGASVADALNRDEFRTALGPVRFDANGDGNLDLFRVFRFDGRDFVADAGG